MNSIRIRGASEHNLKDVSLEIPRDALTVLTGVSGSGKSSLAFDTIYKEGQRRFLESLSAYARQFLGGFEKPKVEAIDGLSPTVSIDQKTVGRSPRSTVGTITEIHDHLRLLFARLGEPHCPRCGKPVATQSAEQICERVLGTRPGAAILIAAPVVRARKGEHRQLLEDLRRDGYTRVRIDGQVVRLAEAASLTLRRHETHSIDVICDRLEARPESRSRLTEAIEKALELADGVVSVVTVAEDGGKAAGAAEELFSSQFACPACGTDLPEMEPRLFSFNSHHGACKECQGLGETEQVDPEQVIADPNLPLGQGGIAFLKPGGKFSREGFDADGFRQLGAHFGFTPSSSWGDLSAAARNAVLHGHGDFAGLVRPLRRLRDRGAAWTLDYVSLLACAGCEGSRLCPEARAVLFREKGIHQLSALPVAGLREWLHAVELTPAEAPIGEPILKNVRSRLSYLEDVGLGYLTLDRRSDTLAGGEAQRLRLASQVGAGLQGVLFVLDEPSIGLHARDNQKLLSTLRTLRDAGNTVLVVEHDRAAMAAADHLVDIGPGAGAQGGEVVGEGTEADLERAPRSVTGLYLAGKREIPVPAARRAPGNEWLEVHGARQNNLQDIDVRIPLRLLVAVTGVSGSGKSSLVNQVLRPALLRKIGRRHLTAGKHRSLRGYQYLDKLVEIDQSPIGRTPRSNPATYVKVFDAIRRLFAMVPEARARGYSLGRFSFNKDGGRCIECEGAGVTTIGMQFLAPVEVTCDLCAGKRYNRETLEILYRGKDIHDVLDFTIDEAAEFFADHPQIAGALAALKKVGLGYMRLGQPSTTLSGGEAQRVKLAAELKKKDTGRTLYLFDEPTTGLHFEDERLLIEAMQDLVERGNSVMVIEHNLDVIKVADHVIDLGPEAGSGGGRVVAQGTPEDVARVEASHTGRFLRAVLRRGAGAGSSGRAARTARPAAPGDAAPRDIEVEGASLHNLKSVSVRIPRQSLTVITGVSGSGKTSLAFDTLFAEGQRRYLDSLSTYARRFLGKLAPASVERISGLSPAIAIDQKSASANPRSTVATMTEVHDYLRLLYARVGKPHCPTCGRALEWTSPTRLAGELAAADPGARAMVLAPIRIGSAVDRSPGAAVNGAFTLGSLRLEDIETLRTTLLQSGFTRVLAAGEEVRLDEARRGPARRILAALKAAASETDGGAAGAAEPGGAAAAGDGTAPRPAVLVVIDRVVLAEGARSRLASSLETAFEKGGGAAAVVVAERPPVFHSKTPSCPAGHAALDEEITPRMFSFSSYHGFCRRCKGLGLEETTDLEALVSRPELPLPDCLDANFREFLQDFRPSVLVLLGVLLREMGRAGRPFAELAEEERRIVFHGGDRLKVMVELAGQGPYQGVKGRTEASWHGLATELETSMREGAVGGRAYLLRNFLKERTCSACAGARLRPESLGVRIGEFNIHELAKLTVRGCLAFFRDLKFTEREAVIARQVLLEIENRLRFLDEVGLGYLTLERSAGTLSGGEAQRIRLASQLGNRLTGVLYVLDEPTVGLHQRDTQRLIASLRSLRDLGNTILIVEHDRETMRAADWLIDMGPGAGAAGGQVLAAGAPAAIARDPRSITGPWLRAGEEEGAASGPRRAPSGWLELEGIQHHNLRDLRAVFPLGVFTAVTGVSGSGKSSLVMDVLAPLVQARLSGGEPPAGRVAAARGLEALKRLVVVDQRPIGRSPRSNAATYTGLWDAVRDLYATLPSSRVRGYTASRFSFNSGPGRCFACDGQGARLVEMHFLSDVWVPCDQCQGKRFDRETLAILFKGKSVGDLLGMEVSEALEFFADHPAIRRILEVLARVGLGYLKLGQAADTLSGGEAQRVKLAAELAGRTGSGALYVLDEPTTGLHCEDVKRLLDVLDALVEGGNTLVVIEHQVDVIRAADWVIDLGPEAGDEGGRIVAQGTPEAIAASPESRTGKFL